MNVLVITSGCSNGSSGWVGKLRKIKSICGRFRWPSFYRPKRSLGQGNIFTPVCHSVHRSGSASVHAGIPPPPPWQADAPWQADPTLAGRPPQQAADPPSRQPPLQADLPWIRSMIGWYASYWNAFLFMTYFHRARRGPLPLSPSGSATGM